MRERRDMRDVIQGVACLGTLWFIMFGDPVRLPAPWLSSIPGGLLTRPAALVFWMLLLYFIEGTRSAEWDDAVSPLRRVLDVYAAYWMACAPLVLVGGLFCCEIVELPIYSPMFRNLGPLNLSRAILALSNNIHEGTWLVSSVALCGFSASLSGRLFRKHGRLAGALALVAGIACQATLYFVALPFMYHAREFRVAAVAGSAVHALGYALFRGRPARWTLPTAPRPFAVLAAPLRFIGRRWVAFWMVQFYVAMYYVHIAATVYALTRSAIPAFLAFAALTALLLLALEQGYRCLKAAVAHSRWAIPAIALTLAVPFLLRLALEASMDSYAQFAHMTSSQWPIRAMVNVLAIFCLMLAFRALMGRWLPAGLTVAALLALLGIANHFTIKYHGAILTVEDVHNLKTVSGVIHSYNLSPDAVALRVLLFSGAGAGCCVAAWLCARGLRALYTRRQRWARRGVCLLAAFLGLYVCYFSPVPVITRQDNAWSWTSLYARIGFLSGTVESTLANLAFSVYKPEGYSEERMHQLAEQAGQTTEELPATGDYPDIVMILNETWYDLDQYIETNADVDYLKNYRALDNAVKGYAEVPLTGGGTNGTEYEMLTANSMTLINAYAPFNRLNFTDGISLPGYLKALGYNTLGAHPHESQNYHRGISWSQMGIDRTCFIHDFTDLEFYARRKTDHQITDTSALKNLIRFMDEMPADRPRFAFMATMQNHGDWTLNRPEDAVVHSRPATSDEALVNQINEFLSCMRHTDDMIAFMRDYYTDLYTRTGRRVVVCMVGDHSPSFLPQLSGLCRWSDAAQAERRGKMTPYFIWANFPTENAAAALQGAEDMDLCCFMPATLSVAGVPLSYYYRSILDMNDSVAVYTNVGAESAEASGRIAFYDRAGQLRHLDEDSPLARQVGDYFCMEYNLSAEDVTREDALFLPRAGALDG